MAKRVRRKAPPTPDISVCECPMFIYFSREVNAEREMMRRLVHRAVDLVVDSGRHYLLGLEVAFSLSFIARDHVTDIVTDLVQDVWAEEKEARCGQSKLCFPVASGSLERPGVSFSEPLHDCRECY